MWLSQKIKNDPEAKKTLNEISKLVNEYSDATKLTKGWYASIYRIFKPWPFLYLIITAFTAAVLFYPKLDSNFFDDLINASLLISVPIFVLGITLSSAVKSLDQESRFAIEYLRDSCKIVPFTYLAFLTVVMGFLCYLVKDADCKYSNIILSILCKYSYKIFASIAVGGTLWCLWSLVYIIVETTKCMYPEFSTKAASNYAARRSIYFVMKKIYLGIWMEKYPELLEAEIKGIENIRPPHEYFALFYNEKSKENRHVVNLPKEIDFHFGYRDYNLKKFKKIDKLLKDKNVKLYLTPHPMNNKESGFIYCDKNCDELLKLIKNEKFCKFKKDKYIEPEKSFWDDHYLKLYKSLLKTVEAKDVIQFSVYLTAIETILNTIINTRKDRLVRKCFELGYEEYRLLRLYSTSVKWILKTGLEEEVSNLFIEETTDSIERQAEINIKNGDWQVLNALKWILPGIYKLFEDYKDSPLWEKRARIGGFYYYAENKLTKYGAKIKEEDKLQIQLTLHTGIVSWLLAAIENKDNGLIKALCETTRKLVFPDKKMKFIPKDLITQHFILCGKILRSFISETPDVDIEALKSLLFDKYNHTERNVVFSELIEFYIESRKNNLRDYLREFEHTDWEINPLVGGGIGTPHYVFDGGEMDYTFIYLALLSISSNEKVMPIEFWPYNIKEKIAKFEKIVKLFKIYDFKQRKELLEKWMDDCGKLYEQREEQRIADAILNPEKVSKYADSFWSGYKKINTFLKFCLGNGYYMTDEAASTKLNYSYPKDAFIGESGDVSGTRDGTEVSRGNGKMLVRSMIESAQESKEKVKDIELALNSACQWLIEKGTTKTDGIIVYCGETYIDGKMYENKDYIPRWKNNEDVCYHGYYKDYPILVIRSKDAEKCVALNLKGWKGLHIRPDVIKDVFGNLTVREWTDEEITKFIAEGKIKEEDRNKVKGQCLVEYELFWNSDKDNLPEQISFCIDKETEDENTNLAERKV